MSFDSMLDQVVRVYERTAETDEWRQVGRSTTRVHIVPLSARGDATEDVLLKPGVTHSARARIDPRIVPGRRVKRASDGAEFLIRTVRQHSRPVPGHMAVNLAAVESAIA